MTPNSDLEKALTDVLVVFGENDNAAFLPEADYRIDSRYKEDGTITLILKINGATFLEARDMLFVIREDIIFHVFGVDDDCANNPPCLEIVGRKIDEYLKGRT